MSTIGRSGGCGGRVQRAPEGGRMAYNLLVVDDEEEIRSKLQELLETQGYKVKATSNGRDALSVIEESPGEIDIVLTDYMMPGMTGIELAEKVSHIDPKIVLITITAYSDKETAIAAMRSGVSDFLDKPFGLTELMFALRKAEDRRSILVQNENYKLNLERMVWDRTQDLQNAIQQIHSTYRQTLEALGAALDTRDVETQSHSQRVAGYTVALAYRMGLPRSQIIEIERGALLHDIGKIGVPDAIFLKPGPLTEEEWRIMRSHVDIGYQMVHKIEFLREASLVIYGHHEKYNGSGYPRGLKAQEIPIGARVFAVADTLDAMTSDRVYRKKLGFNAVTAEVSRYNGIQFDPIVVEAFQQIPEKTWHLIRDRSEAGESLAEAPGTADLVSRSNAPPQSSFADAFGLAAG